MKSFKLFALIAIVFTASSFKPPHKHADKTADKPDEELKWMGWNDGYQLAKKNNKIAMVDCYTEWCGWCKRMDRDTYGNADIQKKIYDNFIPIKFNPELNQTYNFDGKQYDGRQLADLLSSNQLTGYPTIIFIIPNGKTNTIELSVGYSNAQQFGVILDTIKGKKK